jgi:dTDP-4-dehydrorhamnose 3,5-epimerase
VKFRPTRLPGVFRIEIDWVTDARGAFGRAWSAAELESQGLVGQLVQTNISITRSAGTLRGLHYQLPPAEEAKLVRCVRGAIFDVIVDLRAGTPTHGEFLALELRPERYEAVYIPPGTAHGFMTLADDSEVLYASSAAHAPDLERGIRWDDPSFGIPWPGDGPRHISEKDRGWPDHKLE